MIFMPMIVISHIDDSVDNTYCDIYFKLKENE